MRQRAADIQVLGVGKSFGSFRALKDVSLDIGRGEFLTLLGPSGSGKTTLLMILAGFEPPTSGRLLSAGEDITAKPAEARAFGMVFQGYALFPHMTVAQNIAFPLQVRKAPREVVARRVAEMVERVGLAGHENKLPAKLSGGQQQRVALARALVFEPSVLLLDEPFSALDKHLRGRMQEEVKRLHQEFGTTFVFVTHDQSEALSLSSRVAIFNHGEVLQVGAPQDVYERPASRFVAEFLGEINLLPLENVGPCARGLAGTFEGARLVGLGRDDARRSGVLAVRPEHMSLSANGRTRRRTASPPRSPRPRTSERRCGWPRHPRRVAAQRDPADGERAAGACGQSRDLGHLAGEQGLSPARGKFGATSYRDLKP